LTKFVELVKQLNVQNIGKKNKKNYRKKLCSLKTDCTKVILTLSEA